MVKRITKRNVKRNRKTKRAFASKTKYASKTKCQRGGKAKHWWQTKETSKQQQIYNQRYGSPLPGDNKHTVNPLFGAEYNPLFDKPNNSPLVEEDNYYQKKFGSSFNTNTYATLPEENESLNLSPPRRQPRRRTSRHIPSAQSLFTNQQPNQ